MKTNEISEMFGIFLGDGSIRKTGRTYKIEVCGHKVDDRDYLLKYVKPLLERNLGLEFHHYDRKEENAMTIYVHSKSTGKLLLELGAKGGVIPKMFKDDLEALKSCLRGLIDTDGSIYIAYRSKKQPHFKLEFKNTSKALVKGVHRIWIMLGFHPGSVRPDNYDDYRPRWRVALNRLDEIKKYFKTVGSGNPKHLKKIRSSEPIG